MSNRRIDLDEALKNPDLDLITDFLANELDPERVAEVRRRLDDDPAFRDFAAPIVEAWRASARSYRQPMPRAELERSWDIFTKRADFIHQRRESRKRWTILFTVVIALLALVGWAYRRPLYDAYQMHFQFTSVPDSGRVMRLADGTHVRLDPGARLDVHTTVGRSPLRAMRLRGSARFYVSGLGTDETSPGGELYLYTPAGVIHTAKAEFHLRALPQVTVLDVGRPGSQRDPVDPALASQIVYLSALPERRHDIAVQIGEHAYAIFDDRVIKAPRVTPESLVPRQKNPADDPRFDAKRPSPPGDPYVTIPDSGRRGITLVGGALVMREPGAILRLPKIPVPEPMQLVHLDGAATFNLRHVPTAGTRAQPQAPGALIVLTKGGLVTSRNPTIFRVIAIADTTWVDVLSSPPQADPNLPPPGPAIVILTGAEPEMAQSGTIMLTSGMTGRIVRGQKPRTITMRELPHP